MRLEFDEERGVASVSYLRMARPLTLREVMQDMRPVCGKRVDEIVLWQHQLDWLGRLAGHDRYWPERVPYVMYRIEDDADPPPFLPFPEVMSEPMRIIGRDCHPATIYGVPVRVED